MKTLRIAAVILGLMPSLAGAQSVPPNLPYHTVWGRLGAQPGDTGPAQAIPFLTLQRAFTQSGNSGKLANVSGALTAGDCLKADANGNIVDSGTTSCGGGANTPHTQDFIAGTDFTAGTTTTLTLSSAPSSTDLVIITFDGIGQNKTTWSLAGAVITFAAAIPTGTVVVEVKWSTAGTSSGVGSIGLTGSPLTGAVTLSAGSGISINQVGQNIAIGSTQQVVTITDAAYGAKCDGIFQSSQNLDQPSTNLTITSGSPNLTSSAGFFTAADQGKRIWVPGAGVAGAGLSTTIQTVTDATHVVLAANASTSLSGFTTTNAKPLVYGTDDTAAIQAAMDATPIGGTLFIPGKRTGCIIRQQGANAYALKQDHVFNIKGQGHFSNLMTFPDIPSTVDNILVDTGAGALVWELTSWDSFNLSATTSYTPTTYLPQIRYGKRGIYFKGSGYGIRNSTISNLQVGESGNDYSIVLDGASTQNNTITQNMISGGLKLDGIADNHKIVNNYFLGFSTFGGYVDTPGAGGFLFANNVVTWVGGLIIQSGSLPIVTGNYFEEVINGTNSANGAMVDFNGGTGTVQQAVFTNNIVNALVSTTSRPVRYSNSNGGNFGGNSIATSTGRTGVSSQSSLSCIAPNVWNSVGTHFSTALANTYGGC